MLIVDFVGQFVVPELEKQTFRIIASSLVAENH